MKRIYSQTSVEKYIVGYCWTYDELFYCPACPANEKRDTLSIYVVFSIYNLRNGILANLVLKCSPIAL